jgi:hypothetical protein
VQEQRGGTVGDAFGVHAVQEAEVVDVVIDVREEIRGPVAGLAVLLEVPQRLHHALGRAFAGLRHNAGVFDVDDLAVVFEQTRLVVIGIHMADAALHEEENDALGFRLMMGTFDGERIRQSGLALRHGLPGEVAEAAAGGLKEIASGGKHGALTCWSGVFARKKPHAP